MIFMALRAGVSDSAFGAMAFDTALLGRHQNVRGKFALRRCVVAGDAGHVGMLGVIEQRGVVHPAIRDHRRGNPGCAIRARRHFVAGGATGELRATGTVEAGDARDRSFPQIAEEDLFFEEFTGADAIAQAGHLLVDEFLNLFWAQMKFARRMIGVLGRQAAEVRSSKGRVAMRNLHGGVAHIELQRMAGAAILLKGDALHECAGSIDPVATHAIERLAAQGRDIPIQMDGVIEGEGVAIALALGTIDPEFRVVDGEGANRIRKPGDRSLVFE